MERRTAIALLQDRANRLDKAIRAFGATNPGATPPATIKALCEHLRGRLDAASEALLHPAGQIDLGDIMRRETPKAPGPMDEDLGPEVVGVDQEHEAGR